MNGATLQVKSKTGLEREYPIPKRMNAALVDKAFGLMVGGASLGDAASAVGLTAAEKSFLNDTVLSWAQSVRDFRPEAVVNE